MKEVTVSEKLHCGRRFDFSKISRVEKFAALTSLILLLSLACSDASVDICPEEACEKRTTARKIGVPETCEYLLASRIDRTIHPRVQHLPLRMSRVVF